MTETSTIVFPPNRYGRRRQPRRIPRWLLFALAAAVGLGATGVAYKLYTAYGVGDVRVRPISFGSVTTTQVTITFAVTKPAGVPVTCVVRARDRAGAEIGRAEVPVTSTDPSVTMTYTLATTGLAVSGEALGCARMR